jgi:hypothetical protein
MKQFVIRDLERFSGIKAHTLRTWEQRYGVPQPQRSEGKTRLYSLNEFGELLSIALLNRNGYKISHLSALNTGAINHLVKQLRNENACCEIALNEMFVGMYALDVDIIDAVLDKCFLQLPVHTVFSGIILPFLTKTELLWQGNKLTEEHLVVTAIRKKIMWGIEKIGPRLKNDNPVLLFLPDTRQLDLGLLYMNFQLRLRNVPVVYMGNDVSIENLQMIFNKIKPTILYTYLAKHHRLNLAQLSSVMAASLPETKLVVTPGPDFHPASLHNVAFMSYDEAVDYLSR